MSSPEWYAHLINQIELDSLLTGKHVVFGKVIKGYEEVVMKIAQVPVDAKDRPKAPVAVENCGELQLRKKQGGPRAGMYREVYVIDIALIPSQRSPKSVPRRILMMRKLANRMNDNPSDATRSQNEKGLTH